MEKERLRERFNAQPSINVYLKFADIIHKSLLDQVKPKQHNL